ncbi:hypothetical protein OAQ56_00400 [Alphaproteobacteria bacterium]|nr:hypothetical protein [Alphaproteobacteria bacterium]
MNELFKEENFKTTENRMEENLFVDKIIVNKNTNIKSQLPFIATEKWISQLGNRLQSNY